MHPRNRHHARYDFGPLVAAVPELKRFLRPSPSGDPTIDFADPAAVTALNRALLRQFYGVTHWEIPPGYLCPPIPGRADYLHHLADLLTTDHRNAIPRGDPVRILDVGVGANCIYPIIGRHDYGWRFVGSDIDPIALTAARKIVAENPLLSSGVKLRLQPSRSAIFHGIIRPGEKFAAAICNPPFHASAAEAGAGTRRKLRNLGGGKPQPGHAAAPTLNFGGQGNELWCPGGEAGFVRRMVAESGKFRGACRWFTTLVSKSETLPAIHRALEAAKAGDVRTIPMAQGQKKSRIVAWRF
jgi:23S rRNA (adenine1618-N6)-methyltransferase